MASMNFIIPDDLKLLIEKHKDVEWNEIVSQALWEFVQKIELMDSIAARNQLTEQDALIIGHKIKENIATLLDTQFILAVIQL